MIVNNHHWTVQKFKHPRLKLTLSQNRETNEQIILCIVYALLCMHYCVLYCVLCMHYVHKDIFFTHD